MSDVTGAILAASIAAELEGRRPRYIVLGERQWLALRAETAALTVTRTPLEDAEPAIWGLGIVRVGVPDFLRVGY